MSFKAVIWGSCGSLPSPASSASIEEKVREALRASRDRTFASDEEIDAFIRELPHRNRGTYRANTSCVQIDGGSESVILCDAGTGIRDYSLSLPESAGPRTYHIFISHLHWDHIQGFPFFAPAYVKGNRIIFHGFHDTIEATIRGQMDAPCFPVPFEIMHADIEFDIREDGAVFEVDGISVDTIKQQHPGDSWGYRFEKDGKSIIYSTDSEHGPEAREADYPFVDFFRDADVLIFDGQYTFEQASNEKRHWGHSDPITAIELGMRAGVDKLVVFHHEPAYEDEMIERMLAEALKRCGIDFSAGQSRKTAPREVILAYDGLVVEA